MATQIPLDRVVDNPWQTRSSYDEEHIEALAGDINKNGLLQKPVGRLVGADGEQARNAQGMPVGALPGHVLQDLDDNPEWTVQLAFGHNRLRALQLLGEETVPVEVKVLTDRRMATMAWTENAQRKDLSPLEEAEAIQRRMEDFGLTQAQVAGELGMGRSTVANKLRLLKLPEAAREALDDGVLTQRQAGAVLTLFDLEPWQQDLAEEFEESDREGNGGTHHHPMGVFEHALEQGYSAERIRESAESLKRSLKSIWEARQRGGAGEEQPTTEDAAAGEYAKVTATEAAKRLRGKHGIGLRVDELKQRGTEALREALAEAEAQAAKEQPSGTKPLREDLEVLEKWVEQGYDGQPVFEVKDALEDTRQDLRRIGARDTWVREQVLGDLDTPLLISRYQGECTTLSNLKRRARVVRDTLHGEWLPQAKETKASGASQIREKSKAANGESVIAGGRRELDAPSGDALPAEADLGDSEEGRIYDAFRADLLSKLEDVPRWMLLRYLSAAAPTGHNREKGERLRGRVADAMVPRRRYVQQGDPKMTRVNLCDWARGSDLYDWGRRLDPRNGEAAGDGAAEEEPAVAAGGGHDLTHAGYPRDPDTLDAFTGEKG